MKTTQGKKAALKALAERRIENQKKKPFDNSSLPAGSPMYFACNACGGTISVPEGYLSRPQLCGGCAALKNLGWLE